MPVPTAITQNDSLLGQATTLLKDTVDTVASSPEIIRVIKSIGYIGKDMPETIGSNMFIPMLLLVMFFSYGFVITKGRKLILETINDFFYIKERSSIFIESGSSQFKLNANLVFLFVCSFGLFLYIVFYNKSLGFDFSNKISYLFLFIGFSLLFLAVKWLLFKFLSYVFFGANASSIFIRSYFTIIFGYALVLFPLVVFLIYAPNNFYIFGLILSIIVSILTIILIFLKTSQIFLENIVTFLYIILYLCTLEILPIFIVLKALT